MRKYTKTDLVDLMSAKLVVADFKMNKNQIREFMKIYENSVYELLLDGIPVSFGDVGVFKFKTIAAKEERKNNFAHGKDVFPAHEAYSKIKFHPSKSLIEQIRERTLGSPYDTKASGQESDMNGC